MHHPLGAMNSEVIDLPKTDLSKAFQQVRSLTEQICAPLKSEDYVPQPVAYISPPKWHLAHTTWFFETFILRPHLKGYQVYHDDFSYLFNSYYNAVGNRVLRADRGNITRPGVSDIYDYRKHVDDQILNLLRQRGDVAEIRDLLVLGLHHEQQHQELLLTDLKFILGHNPLFPVYQKDFSMVAQVNGASGFIKMAEDIYEIGYRGSGFHFDNELGRHKYYLQDFEISRRLVTNGAFQEFVEDGGYQKASLWLDDGWTWVRTNKMTAPLYWHLMDDQWNQYTLSGLQPLEEDQVLGHINFYEAAAFAEWSGLRLPTEFEWEAASSHLPWGIRWEWTQSAYLPYPGFRTAPGALGEYNGKFMINQMVLRGASAATSPGHSRPTYRNFFHPHLGWQCSGIRLVKR